MTLADMPWRIGAAFIGVGVFVGILAIVMMAWEAEEPGFASGGDPAAQAKAHDERADAAEAAADGWVGHLFIALLPGLAAGIALGGLFGYDVLKLRMEQGR